MLFRAIEMATAKYPAPASTRVDIRTTKEFRSDIDDLENIPYHAREYARPFTYGNLPEGFTTDQLNHVVIDEVVDAPKTTQTQAVVFASPTMSRKCARPRISHARPVLRKTPSREEFEKMLMERREQALHDQNVIATKLAQKAAIQKDLSQLQEILNKNGVLDAKTTSEEHIETPVIQEIRTTILNKNGILDSKTTSGEHIETPMIQEIRTVARSSDNATSASGGRLDNSKSFTKGQSTALFTMPKEPERAATPTFPHLQRTAMDERCISPYPMVTPGTPTLQRITSATNNGPQSSDIQQKAMTDNIVSRSEPQQIEPHLVKFAKDSSEYWYKPHMTREEAVALLRNAVPGTFLIRNSTTYKNAFGLVLRVEQPPAGVKIANSASNDELVRHYLLEPTACGVRLKGYVNEPVFTSLSAFVYQHSINELALPCPLIIPDNDLLQSSGDAALIQAQKQILAQGAACNVLYLFTCNTESLTGDEAIRLAVNKMFTQHLPSKPIVVHFKVSQLGITLTDNKRIRFFRRHYIAENVSHFGSDPDNHSWTFGASNGEQQGSAIKKTIFAFVARTVTGSKDNECHVFCDMAANQPTSAIVSFAHRVLPLDKKCHKML